MGDRISIAFVNRNEKSAVLSSHWRGLELRSQAYEYLAELHAEQETKERGICEPLDRLEPDTLLVDFVRWLTKDEKRITSDLRLVPTEGDCDNSDNGHFDIDLNCPDWYEYPSYIKDEDEPRHCPNCLAVLE